MDTKHTDPPTPTPLRRSPHLVVVGGGFAGVWAALAAERRRRLDRTGRDRLTITLVSDRPTMGMKPRYHERDQDAVEVPLTTIFEPTGVRVAVRSVERIDPVARRIWTSDGELAYDAVVLAAGSRATPPEIPGRQHLFGLDDGDQARRLDEHLAAQRRLADPAARRAVVVGGGFTGVEIAAELATRLQSGDRSATCEVVLVERSDVIAADYGPAARREIKRALARLGVRCVMRTTIESLDETSVELSNGKTVAARTVVWTGGVRANAFAADLGVTTDPSGRIDVDAHLAVRGVDGVWAAGDVAAALADGEHLAPMTCQHAIPQGKVAGHNAAEQLLASAVAATPVEYRQHLHSTCLDLGAEGALVTLGPDRGEVVATGRDADDWKRYINRTLIYPPLDGGLDALLDAAKPDRGGPVFAWAATRAVRSRRVRRRLMASAVDGPSALTPSA